MGRNDPSQYYDYEFEEKQHDHALACESAAASYAG